jgi:hypothetical protein
MPIARGGFAPTNVLELVHAPHEASGLTPLCPPLFSPTAFQRTLAISTSCERTVEPRNKAIVPA